MSRTTSKGPSSRRPKSKTAAKKTVAKVPKPATPLKEGTVKPVNAPVAAAAKVQAQPFKVVTDKATNADHESGIIKRKEIFDLVAKRTDVNRADTRAVFDATLETLSEMIAQHEEIVVPPLGKIKVKRKEEKPNGTLAILRVMLRKPKPDAADGDTDA